MKGPPVFEMVPCTEVVRVQNKDIWTVQIKLLVICGP